MEDIIVWGIVALVLFVKFGIIIGVALWSRAKQEKEKKMFLEQQERLRMLRQTPQE